MENAIARFSANVICKTGSYVLSWITSRSLYRWFKLHWITLCLVFANASVTLLDLNFDKLVEDPRLPLNTGSLNREMETFVSDVGEFVEKLLNELETYEDFEGLRDKVVQNLRNVADAAIKHKINYYKCLMGKTLVFNETLAICPADAQEKEEDFFKSTGKQSNFDEPQEEVVDLLTGISQVEVDEEEEVVYYLTGDSQVEEEEEEEVVYCLTGDSQVEEEKEVVYCLARDSQEKEEEDVVYRLARDSQEKEEEEVVYHLTSDSQEEEEVVYRLTRDSQKEEEVVYCLTRNSQKEASKITNEQNIFDGWNFKLPEEARLLRGSTGLLAVVEFFESVLYGFIPNVKNYIKDIKK